MDSTVYEETHQSPVSRGRKTINAKRRTSQLPSPIEFHIVEFFDRAPKFMFKCIGKVPQMFLNPRKVSRSSLTTLKTLWSDSQKLQSPRCFDPCN